MVSLSNSSRLPASTDTIVVNPVMFPPGRARLSTNPFGRIGSVTSIKTIGIVLVAFLAATGSGRIGGDNHVNFKTDQLLGQRGESVDVTLGVSILEDNILPLNIAEFTQILAGTTRSRKLRTRDELRASQS